MVSERMGTSDRSRSHGSMFLALCLLLLMSVSLSGCSVLELLFTGTTEGIENGRMQAAWAQASMAETQRQAERAAADRADAEARVREAQNAVIAQAQSFALAQAEITQRQHNSEMFHLAYTQLTLEHSEREAQRIDAGGKPEPPQLKPWVPVAAGGLGLVLGGGLVLFFVLKRKGGY